jgi:serine/threonine protein kinase
LRVPIRTERMIRIPGYQVLELISHDSAFSIYCGVNTQDKTPVLLKLASAQVANPDKFWMLSYELDVTRTLNLPGVVKGYSVEKHRNQDILILEDFGGYSIREWISKCSDDLNFFLDIATKVTDILGEIHAHRIIHKDLKPEHILYHPQTHQIKITGFHAASSLPRETPAIASPHKLEGTLVYMPPEQTGRMNRQIDYRADFYALGVTFYELLTGQLPFLETDPLALIHCHIAKQPPSPEQLNSAIPSAVAAIIRK